MAHHPLDLDLENSMASCSAPVATVRTIDPARVGASVRATWMAAGLLLITTVACDTRGGRDERERAVTAASGSP
jgi:hypothetical protein